MEVGDVCFEPFRDGCVPGYSRATTSHSDPGVSTMNEEDELDEGADWFHEFAKLPVEDLIQQATDINRTMFKNFVIANLPGHVPPENQSPAEFAATVLELRANERGWNRALGRALIDADDIRSEGNVQAAISTLRSFADSCPWKAFRDLAHIQADNLEKRRDSSGPSPVT
jgi:hypothetical protein